MLRAPVESTLNQKADDSGTDVTEMLLKKASWSLPPPALKLNNRNCEIDWPPPAGFKSAV